MRGRKSGRGSLPPGMKGHGGKAPAKRGPVPKRKRDYRAERQPTVYDEDAAGNRASERLSIGGDAEQAAASASGAASAGPTRVRPAVGSKTVPSDIGARLAALPAQKWFIPEAQIAEMLGLADCAALREWVAGLKRAGRTVFEFGADVEVYGELSDELGAWRPQFWLVGDGVKKPTASNLGMHFTHTQQSRVVRFCRDRTEGVLFGTGRLVRDTANASKEWAEIVDFAYENPAVFHLEAAVEDALGNAPNASSRARVHRSVESCLVARLEEMRSAGLFAELARGQKHAPKDRSGQAQPSKEEQRTPIAYFEAESSTEHGGRPPLTAITRLALLVMIEHEVSESRAPALLDTLLRLYGFEPTSAPPSRRSVQTIVKEGEMLAHAELGRVIIERGELHPESGTFSIDAASMGEDKYEGIAITWRDDAPVDPADPKSAPFTGVRLGLTELSKGDDATKQIALQDNLEDIVVNTNRIYEDDAPWGEMTMYHHARVMGATVNDHAESVVQNRFVPWMQKLLDDHRGGDIDIVRKCVITTLCCLSQRTVISTQIDDNTPLWHVKLRNVRPRMDTTATAVEADTANAINPWNLLAAFAGEGGRVSEQEQQQHREQYYSQAQHQQPRSILRTILELAYPSLTTNTQWLADWRYFCHNHKLCVTMTHGMNAIGAVEWDGGAISSALAVENANQPPGSYKLANAASTAIMSVAKLGGKHKRVHETLTHTKLLAAARDVYGVAHLHFERLLGSRGASGMFANAAPTFEALLDDGDWGMAQFIVKLESASRSTNKLHAGVNTYLQSDVTLAELWVMALLHHAVLRPMQTYIQNHNSQKDMLALVAEYRTVLEKLAAVTHLTPGTFAELPWIPGIDSALISVCNNAWVTSAKRTALRTKAVEQAIQAPGLPGGRNSNQLGLMALVLQRIAGGMLAAIDNLTELKYGDLYHLPTDDKLAALDDIPSTSDAIERYFGLASYLLKRNPNLTKTNLNHQLNIIETQVGSWLAVAYQLHPALVTRMVTCAWKATQTYEADLKTRRAHTQAEQIKHYEDADKAAKQRRAKQLAKMQEYDAKAQAWVHRPLTHWSERSVSSGAHRSSGLKVDTIASLVANEMERAGGTELQWEAAAKKLVVHWLEVFEAVHKLNHVESLRDVFFGATGRHNLQGSRSLRAADGAPGELMTNLFCCSEYVHLRSSNTSNTAP